MLNGLDLFSGIGGGALSLAPWVYPVAYCEIDPYCRGVLLSRMWEGALPLAPIWDDVRTLEGSLLYTRPDIIYGGFPCQDISVAGRGAGLAGERSGLYWEIYRLVGELKPRFVFLENVPAITSRGGVQVVESLAALGYDCRWTILSAAAVGANHRRERWWLLAYANHGPEHQKSDAMANPKGKRLEGLGLDIRSKEEESQLRLLGQNVANSERNGCDQVVQPIPRGESCQESASPISHGCFAAGGGWWATEPDVGRVAHGIPSRVDRIRGLGNAWVPAQARAAFQILSGMKEETKP